MKHYAILATILISTFAKADYPDFISVESPGIKKISSHNFSSVYMGSHQSDIKNLKLVGSGVRDQSNGNVAGYACVGQEAGMSEPSCKVIRKFYVSSASKNLYFFDEAFLNTAEPTKKEIKKTVKFAMFYNSLSNDTSNNKGAEAGTRIRGVRFNFELTQASLQNGGWSWAENQKTVSHKAFGYFIGHFGNALQWHGINE